MNPMRAALAAVAVAAATTIAAPTTAHAAVQPPQGLTRWDGRTVYVHDTIGDPITRLAAAEWDRLGVIHVRYTSSPCRPNTACVEVTHARLKEFIGGVTPTRIVAGRIIGAQVVINNLYQPSGSYMGLPVNWALNVTAHELGHALGLVHAPKGVCALMAPVACDTPAPTAYDEWMLKAAYAD